MYFTRAGTGQIMTLMYNVLITSGFPFFVFLLFLERKYNVYYNSSRRKTVTAGLNHAFYCAEQAV